MTNPTIEQAIAELDADCTSCDGERDLTPGFADAAWCKQYHRDIRNLAKVAQERMRERAASVVVRRTFGGPLFHEAVAALPLETSDNDRQPDR